MSGFAQFFVEGGYWMIPIGALSILVLAVIIERGYYLLFVFRENRHELMSTVRSFVVSNEIQKAIDACEEKPRAPLSQIFDRVLRSFQNKDGDSNQIELAMEESSMDVVPEVQKRSHTLAGLASLATLLGLLGTVMGLIEAFAVVADAPPDQKSILLTKAISVAMNCTAFGLIVAIPAMFFQLLVSGAVKKILDDIDACTLKLENLLLARKDRGGRG